MSKSLCVELSRRTFVRTFAGAFAAPHLAACGAPSGHASDDRGSGDATDTSEGSAGDAWDGSGEAATRWATGGTAAMVASASYPNPFDVPGASRCSISCATTIGPCHTASPQRQDVSNGADGLPVRLEVRLLDEACAPVSGAVVEIWHANTEGVYSGEINALCNDSADDRVDDFCRGYVLTDVDGIARFDTCYPGWYRGRAVHIHVRVLAGAYDAANTATAELVTQLFFPDALNAEIFGNAPVYTEQGEPDTSLARDGIAGGADAIADYVCDIQRMSDGAMLASKTLILRIASAPCAL